MNIPKAIKLLKDVGYDGIWGIESVPREISEIEGAKKTMELIKRTLQT